MMSLSAVTDSFLEACHRVAPKFKGLAEWLMPFAVSSLAAIVASVLLLMLLQGSFLKLPLSGATGRNAGPPAAKERHHDGESDYGIISERNLFRAKLAVEIPKPKSEKELEEEALSNIMKPMVLKGVWISQSRDDTYAVVDRGPQRGVWIYRTGDTIDRGLTVAEIKQNSVVFKKNDFAATLRLFAKGFDKTSAPPSTAKTPPPKAPATRKPR